MSRRAPCLTKTEQLRQAKTSAYMRDLEKKQAASKQADPFSRRKRVVMPEPKKVDFKKPGLTKAMIARMKHAEKFKQEFERKQEALLTNDRRPQRTPAPIGGDARVGRERVPGRAKSSKARSQSRPRTPAASPPRRSPRPGPSRAPSAGRKTPRTPKTPKKTAELAKLMNADVIQAEPIGEGPIHNVVIPAGVVKDNRTTIVSIPQPQVVDATAEQGPSRPIQVIRLPDIDDPSLQVPYGRDHPDVVAAREFMAKHRAEMEAREAMRRMEEEFQKVGTTEQANDFNFNVPFEEELYQDKDVSWVEDEQTGSMFPQPSRVKAYTEDVPAAERPIEFEPFDPDVLERFFDLKRFPPCPACSPKGPPQGREGLNPDLWDLDDPWYKPPPDGPDLIEFDLIDFD